ncbi:SpoIIE family protein phosphatase [Streptacidiphilus sp. ASG 303]|uniref:SpoIIE family protein phosphatase n=1 Tax=Streptacidiphilus sp. ASG 303 TaxID=2896847 RepID=UPI001E2E722E|nr:SpoIIE family protein phosphatase [Streptacidiphilus sp. ASG 303]MCD0481496.1 SpoIIE family protein phosphatase [Streptacidiphilus sp. ASG 303]
MTPDRPAEAPPPPSARREPARPAPGPVPGTGSGAGTDSGTFDGDPGTGTFDWDLRSGRLVWDEPTRLLLGLPAGVLEGRADLLRRRLDPGDLHLLDAAVRAAAAACGPCRARFRVPRPDGPDRRLAAHGRALSGPGGGAARIVGTVRDVTAEEDLAVWLRHAVAPRSVPSVPVPGVTVAARPATASGRPGTGGDWCDAIPLPGAHLGLVVGRVRGRGAHAAAVTGQLRAALRAYAAEGHDPAAVVSRASRFLAGLGSGISAGCTYVDLDTLAGTAEVVRAGHRGPLVRGPHGDCDRPDVEGGPPLGVDPEDGHPVTRLDLEPGAVLLLRTDAATESRPRRPSYPPHPSHPDRRRDPDPHPEGDGQQEEGGPGGDARALCAHLAAAPADDLDALADGAAALLRSRHGGPDGPGLLLARWDAPPGHVLRRRLRRAVDPADLVAVGRVRRQLRAALHRWGVGDLADTAELLVSELVTNALVHTDHGAVLAATLVTPAGGTPGRTPPHGTRLRVEVRDGASQRPRARTPGEHAASGRGLLLVQALADDWGVQPRGDGKATWFELVRP